MTDLENQKKERVILVGLTDTSAGTSDEETMRSVEELELLADTAGAMVVGTAIQKRHGIDGATFIGQGKLGEIAAACEELDAETIVFDDELTGAQIRNIENITERKIIDRTLLILDIFASRAESAEGKLQVELAQLKYRYSRLAGMGVSLSRLGGGIGTRGPGETKLETDRRHIKRRMDHINKQLKKIGSRRGRIRKSRRDRNVVNIAVTGYTNAGKSTLINRICKSTLYSEDKLFATLDPAVKRIPLQEGPDVVLTDTVGLIRKLPHHLIEAFNSTLEEIVYADVVMHVVDSSDPDMQRHMEIADKLLEELGTSGKPRITVFNKIDIKGFQEVGYAPFTGKNVFLVSAVTGEGIEKLVSHIKELASAEMLELSIFVPYSDAGVLDIVRKNGKIENPEYLDEGIKAKISIDPALLSSVSKYVIK